LRMKRINSIKNIIICILFAGLIMPLGGCSIVPVHTSFDEYAKAAEELEKSKENDSKGSQQESQGKPEAKSGDLDEEIELDVEELPENIEDMVGLCEALNMYQYDSGKMYNYANDEFVWNSLQRAIASNKKRINGIEENNNNIITVTNSVANDFGFALFGDLTSLPNVPNKMVEDHQCFYTSTSIDNEIKYNIAKLEEIPAYAEVRKAVIYPDTTAIMEVATISSITGSEICDYTYFMRMNIRDLSTSARFQYEIVSCKPSSKNTISRMAGIPYIGFEKQIYGHKLYIQSDPKYNEVLEIPHFLTAKSSAEIDKLNEKIEKDLALNEDDLDENQWAEIISYPVSNDKYLQVICSKNIYPSYGTCGDITSYNFDINNRYTINLAYAYVIAGTTREALDEKVRKADFSDFEEYSEYDHCDCQGFLIRENGSIDFYFKLFFESIIGEEPFEMFGSINSKDGVLKIYENGEDLVDEDLVSEEYPPLTHGKN